MKSEIEKTKKMKSVQVSGKNLDDALEQASLELGLPLRVLEYEILDRGKAGFLGIKSSPCRIIAYESVKNKMARDEKSLEEEFDLKSYEKEDVTIAVDFNGRIALRLASDGAWAKVYPAKGEGLPIVIEDVVGKLHDRSVLDLNMDIIAVVVEQADSMWVKVGEFSYNPGNDALGSIEVTEEGMKAYIKVTEPGPG
ncbi:MAG: Jag N-terminal domain-containing protein, partial [Spirochaetaceae bacterium]|nr:Jag N-terminal domain-containing protein [Spirochaetaceae bacterium]